VELGAGRGGKTTHLAELLEGQGLLVAVDYHRRRLLELRHNLERWGADSATHILQADAALTLPLKTGTADTVVLDAPCSALGIVRRHPEIKTRLQEGDLETFPPRQQAMLAAAAPLVRPGGRLLYITCSPEPAENEEVIAAFLSTHPDFPLYSDPALLPPAARDLVQPSGFFHTAPETHDLDGFFAAVLVRD
jgi:16S rRNA (cytosine967-C5)-methyltransferase